MPRRTPSRLALRLRDAIATLRVEAGDPLGAVAVITPTRANAQLAQRTLAETTPCLRVFFDTPAALLARIGRLALLNADPATAHRRPTPAGWTEASLTHALPSLAAAHPGVPSLDDPAWIPALARAAATLETAAITPDDLRRVRGDGLRDRAALLADLTEHLTAARADAALLAPADLHRAALAAITADALPSQTRFAGLVTLGDGVLPHSVFAALRALCAHTPTVHLAVAPLDHLPPAPLGLRAAAGPRVLPDDGDDASAPATRLDRLKRRLFRAPDAPDAADPDATSVDAGRPNADPDASVTLAATPDELREIDEAVRVLLAAIDHGVPLDRLAIAPPDAATADALAEALARAEIPATWLVGPPLATTTPARLLTLALALTAGDHGVATWYELLRFPGVVRRGALAATAPTGTGRWRRLLGSLDPLAPYRPSAAADTAPGAPLPRTVPLLAAIARFADAAADPADRDAALSLHRAVAAFSAELAALPRRAPLGDHAAAWRRLVTAYLPGSLERAQLDRLLASWGPPGRGPAVDRDAAHALLRQALDATQILRGALTDRAVRVVPPMALLGADLDVVCVLGLNAGRFPRDTAEDPLLPDALVAALNAGLGEPRLVASTHLRDAERRRLAAAVAAPREALWLSVPRAELVTARPVVPGTLALEVATALLDARASYRHLDALMVRAGARDAFAPPSPDAAVHADEHLIAAAAADPAALAAHPWARRLLRLHRSLDRAWRPRAEEGATPDDTAATDAATPDDTAAARALDPWSGYVPPEVRRHPALGAEPLPPALLAGVVASPSTYFFRHLLGAWRPRWLAEPNRASAPWVVNRRALAVIEALADADAPDPATIDRAVDAVIARAVGPDGDPDAPEERVGRALVVDAVAEAVARHTPLVPGPRAVWPPDGAPLGVGPWRLGVEGDHVGGGSVVAWFPETGSAAARHPDKALRLELQALAIAHAGGEIAETHARRFRDTRRPPRFDPEATRARAEAAWQRVEAGVWPVEEGAFALGPEGALDDEARAAFLRAARVGGEAGGSGVDEGGGAGLGDGGGPARESTKPSLSLEKSARTVRTETAKEGEGSVDSTGAGAPDDADMAAIVRAWRAAAATETPEGGEE